MRRITHSGLVSDQPINDHFERETSTGEIALKRLSVLPPHESLLCAAVLQQFPLALFFTRNARFVSFGFFLALFSSFGQTFYVALFNGVLNDELGLSSSQLGGLYGAATFISAVLLIGIGKLIDVWDLRVFTVFSFTILAAACLMFANVTGPLTLLVAILGLRLGGQGLMSHTALTSMSRYFENERGIAVSIANIGFAAGVAIFPFIGAVIIAVYGWRGIWTGSAVFILCICLPWALFLLRGQTTRHANYVERQNAPQDETSPPRALGWTRSQVLRDKRFYLLMPIMMSMPFVATGIQFHQIELVEEKGWVLATFASGYFVAAIFNVVGGLSVGSFITRLGGISRIMPWFMAPLCVSMILLVSFDTPLIIWIYMITNGINGGMFGVVHNVLWAELYGTQHLGAIRSLVTSTTIFAAALAPAVMGWLLDSGWTMRLIAAVSLGYIVVAMVITTRVKIASIPPPAR